MSKKINYFSWKLLLTQLIVIIFFLFVVSCLVYFFILFHDFSNYFNEKIIDKLNSFSLLLIWLFFALYTSLIWYILSFKKLFKRLKYNRNELFNKKIYEIEKYFYTIIILSIITSIVYTISVLWLFQNSILISLSIGIFSMIFLYIITVIYRVFIFFFKLLKVYLNEDEE